MKILVIRFSSIGDLTQALSIPAHIHRFHPTAEIHFLTRDDFSELASLQPDIFKVWSLERKKGLSGLNNIIQDLQKENFTHIYDAHNNLRSLWVRFKVDAPNKLVRPMMRIKRFFLLNFKINLFEKPFSGQRDLLKPLEAWNMPFSLPAAPVIQIQSNTKLKVESLLSTYNLKNFTVLVPSAAYALKRWPLEHFKKLIEIRTDHKFVVLAGPQDHFTAELNHYPNVINLTGKTNLVESAAVIEKAQAVITNDTGLLHFSEQLGKPTIALMGPAPFGFPSRPSTIILEKDLACRPCSKHGQGPCTHQHYQACMATITPEEVSQQLQNLISK